MILFSKIFKILIGAFITFPAFNQSREQAPYLALSYISSVRSIDGFITPHYDTIVNVFYLTSIGKYNPNDLFMSDTKGAVPVLPYWLILQGDTVTCPSNAFLKIAERYGDTCYNRTKWFPWRGNIVEPIVNDTIFKIHIICNSDYDKEHPKGVFLDNITGIEYQTHLFIPIEGKYLQKPQFTLKRLSDFNENDKHIYIFSFFNWGLLTPPLQKGKYIFTILVEDEKGKSHTFEYPEVYMDNKIHNSHFDF